MIRKTRHHAIDSESIYDLEDKLNKFSETHEVKATQIFPVGSPKGKKPQKYEAMIYWLEKPTEPIFNKAEKPQESQKKENPITDKQKEYLTENKAYLKKLGITKPIEQMTSKEAYPIYNSIMEFKANKVKIEENKNASKN